MQYYNATVRLAGSTINEVPKYDLSAPEVLVLQYIHGVDAVVKLQRSANKPVKSNAEKERLKSKYDQALVKREQSIDRIFGALGQLPQDLPDEVLEMHDIYDEDDVVEVAKSATRKSKKLDDNPDMVKNQTEANRLDRVLPAEAVNMDDLVDIME
jgi:hypothetical protein